MKAKLQFRQKDTPYGYKETKLEKIKITDEEGKYVKFAKHTPELIEFLQKESFDIPQELIK